MEDQKVTLNIEHADSLIYISSLWRKLYKIKTSNILRLNTDQHRDKSNKANRINEYG